MSGRSGSGDAISRRRALGLIGLGAAAVTAGVTGWATLGSAGTTRPASGLPSGEPLALPPELASRQGRLDVELAAAPGATLAGHAAAVWGYNGSSPGPTLRVRPGDVLSVRLRNGLDQPTNLHTHGLRVSPEGNSDNPFIHIAPGEAFDYRIAIPDGHPPGTFWYHPHAHGYVAGQLFAGLAGALLVDDALEPAVSADRVLLITDTTLDKGGPAATDPATRMVGRQGELLLLNGQHQPVIAATTGDLQRWRLINATTSRTLTLRLDAHTLARIALDGVTLPAATTGDTVRLAPGNRADVLVRPDRPGTFTLTADTEPRAVGMMGGAAAGGETETLATLATGGPALARSALPTFPAGPAPTAGVTTGARRLAFTMGMGGGMGGMGSSGQGMSLGFDGRAFDPVRTDQNVALGAVEEWTITNSTTMAHPFHLHVWPFEVLADSAGTPTTGTVQDVVLVPAGGWVRLRIPFTALPGRSVYHCHILDHEDAGMMATIAVS